MVQFRSFGRDAGDKIRFNSEYVNSRVVLANVEEKEVIPAGYNAVIINATAPIYVLIGTASTAASIPTDVSDGTASELSPTGYAIKSDQTHISIISPSNCIATFAYYYMDR
jgi:hypothetical protein